MSEKDDHHLFLEAIGDVRRMDAPPEAPSKPKPRAGAGMRERDEQAALSEFKQVMLQGALDPGDVSSYRRNEVNPQVLARLKRGEYAVQDELDLHGLRLEEASHLLRVFLRHVLSEGIACVRIIHGKGRNSEGVPVIKNLVDQHLRHRRDVLAFHSAPTAQGGTGAVLVLLKKR
jgi:DNA-nicking Smr family endonuclease